MAYKSLDSVCLGDIEALGIPLTEAEQLHQVVKEVVDTFGACSPETWYQISKRVLTPELPFSFHQMMYYGCYKDYGPDPPVWSPEPKTAVQTNVGKFLENNKKRLRGLKYENPISSFSTLMDYSVSNLEIFWKLVLAEIDVSFSNPPNCMLQECPSDERSPLNPGGDWLPGAYLNAAKNCLIPNSKRSLEDCAIRWRDEGNDDLPLRTITYAALRDKVWLAAYALDALGLEKGSAIAIDMPMHVNAVVIYLAIVLAGYVVVSIADSFAAQEISTRLKISKAKAIFTQDVILRGGKFLPLYSRVMDAEAPMTIVIPAEGDKVSVNLRTGDLSWKDFLDNVKSLRGQEYVAVERPMNEFTNVLFSSGTTGEPKAIPWSLVTPLKAAADGWCHLDIRKGDVVAWPTNLGWMMGPWLIYASLINGASMALYNGSPLSSGFAKFVQDAGVTMLGVIPSMVRTWKSTNCTAGCDWSTIRCFGSTGEASCVDDYLWLMSRALYKPVIEYCGGTEIGGAFVTGSLLQPQTLCGFSTPAMGCSLFILGDDGKPLPKGKAGAGELALGPQMFGASSVLLNGDHYKIYFEEMPSWESKRLRRHGDMFERSSSGYFHALGRADDTMNLQGIKVSSVEIERVCNSADPNILETAAIGVTPATGGTDLVIFVVLKDETVPNANTDHLKSAFNLSLKSKMNPLFRVSRVVLVPSLPRTATNKVMRRVLRKQLCN